MGVVIRTLTRGFILAGSDATLASACQRQTAWETRFCLYPVTRIFAKKLQIFHKKAGLVNYGTSYRSLGFQPERRKGGSWGGEWDELALSILCS